MQLHALWIAVYAAVSLVQAAELVSTDVVYRLVDAGTGVALGSRLLSQNLPAQASATCTPSTRWHLISAGPDLWKIQNTGNGELLGIRQSITSAPTLVLGADDGSPDHVWRLAGGTSGLETMNNIQSHLALGIAKTTAGSEAATELTSGASGQTWRFIPNGPAYPEPLPLSTRVVIHDPAMVRTGDGTFYLFGTHGGLRMFSSRDRADFTKEPPAFAIIPFWTAAYTKGDLWAPDVSFHNGHYWLYYAASKFGTNTSAIGLAVSTTAASGSWSDKGMVYSSNSSSEYNAIDPGLIVDRTGNWWLSFGSFWNGLNLIQIDPATGMEDPRNRRRYRLAHRPSSPAIEAAYIFSHDRYYYLFASLDLCCRGVASTYHIVVGRSTDITGPYYDRCGVPMMQGGGTILLSSHGNVIGPGGQIVMHDGAGDLLVYHYYDGSNHGIPALGMNQICWDSEQWPSLCVTQPPQGQ